MKSHQLNVVRARLLLVILTFVNISGRKWEGAVEYVIHSVVHSEAHLDN